MQLPPDDELVARLRNGDDRAFALVLDAWSDGLLRLARSFVPSHDTAAEVVQETWIAVIRGIPGFEGRSALKTWVYRICVNVAKRHGVRESRTIPMDGPTVDPARFQPAGEDWAGHWRELPAPWPVLEPPTPEREALAAEVRARLAAALDELPSRQRTVITLRDIEGYDAAEVCAMLEITAANQRVLLHRARAFVRGRLETYFAESDQEVTT